MRCWTSGVALADELLEKLGHAVCDQAGSVGAFRQVSHLKPEIGEGDRGETWQTARRQRQSWDPCRDVCRAASDRNSASSPKARRKSWSDLGTDMCEFVLEPERPSERCSTHPISGIGRRRRRGTRRMDNEADVG